MGRTKLELTQFFAIVLQRRRRSRGVSRQALAEQAGLHQTAVGLIERGLRKPNLDTAHLLAEALQVELSELIQESEKLRRQAREQMFNEKQKSKK